jgi:hypothetical protein
MGELVAIGLHRSYRAAKRGGRVLRFGAVGQVQDARILGFAARYERWSPAAPLQLKVVEHG